MGSLLLEEIVYGAEQGWYTCELHGWNARIVGLKSVRKACERAETAKGNRSMSRWWVRGEASWQVFTAMIFSIRAKKETAPLCV
jgi:hypothetical protein